MREGKRWLICALLMAGLLLFGTGCPPPNTGKPPDKKKTEKHEAAAPHGGILFAPPGQHDYHGELKVDKAGKTATVYLFDEDVEKAVPTKAEAITLTVKDTPPVQITLKADRQNSDPEGQSSRFSGTHERLGSDLDPEKVEISVMIKGKQYELKVDKD
jgi:hypothetical protein